MIKTPEIVNDIVRAVSEKLGQAILRKVNSREEYFVLDLAFSYFQKQTEIDEMTTVVAICIIE